MVLQNRRSPCENQRRTDALTLLEGDQWVYWIQYMKHECVGLKLALYRKQLSIVFNSLK